MVTKALTVIAPGKALARRSTGTALASRNTGTAVAKVMAGGLALIREQLSDDIVQHFIAAAGCGEAHGDMSWLHRISNWHSPHQAEYAERAKSFYRSALQRVSHVASAEEFLKRLRRPFEPITYEQAKAMLHVLFVSMTGKPRIDEAAMVKLTECAEIFSPTNNALGEALRLWRPVPMHPVTLALAIKRLKASKTFEPSEEELRDALDKVAKECARLECDASEWVTRLQKTDALMFEADRDGWDAAHAAANNDGAEAFVVMWATNDDDGPYGDALNALRNQTFDEYGDRRDAVPAIAACDARTAKRTRKLAEIKQHDQH
jgi:hypothetical protein